MTVEKDVFKARLAVKGYMQDSTGIELFSPVVRYETIRVALAIASALSLKMSKFDVKTAFLINQRGFLMEVAESVY